MTPKRIAAWLGGAIAAVIVIAVAATAFVEYEKTRPKRVTKYHGLALGSTSEEALYVLGLPSAAIEPDVTSGVKWFLPVEDIKAPRGIEDFDEWVYEPSKDSLRGRVEIGFAGQPKRVATIACFAEHSSPADCEHVLGLPIGTTEEAVRARLGEPAREEYAGTSKRLDYPQWNLRLSFAKQQLYYVTVKDFTK